MGTTTSDGRVRRPRRVIPWLAVAGIVTTFGTAAVLFLLEVLSHFDDDTSTPTPTPAPELVAGAAVVALIASPILPVLAAASGGALLLAGVLLAYSGACAGSSAAPAA